MTSPFITRRRFVAATSAGSLAAVASQAIPATGSLTVKSKLALRGGDRVLAKKPASSQIKYSVKKRKSDEKQLDTSRSFQ